MVLLYYNSFSQQVRNLRQSLIWGAELKWSISGYGPEAVPVDLDPSAFGLVQTHSLDRSGAGLDTGKRELVRLALEGIYTSVWIRDRHSDQFHTVVGKVSATLKLE